MTFGFSQFEKKIIIKSFVFSLFFLCFFLFYIYRFCWYACGNLASKINKIRRNKAGEITGIKVSLDDNQGRKSSASWKEKKQAIPDIVLGKSGNKLFVRAISN